MLRSDKRDFKARSIRKHKKENKMWKKINHENNSKLSICSMIDSKIITVGDFNSLLKEQS